jgi:hypothetical protein
MRSNVCFAQTVIRDLRHYDRGKEQDLIGELEHRLEKNPLIGFECVEGIPSVRALNHLFERPLSAPYIPTLGFHYVFLPLADFIAAHDVDEVFVFRVGKPVTNGIVRLSPREQREIIEEVIGIHQAAAVVG